MSTAPIELGRARSQGRWHAAGETRNSKCGQRQECKSSVRAASGSSVRQLTAEKNKAAIKLIWVMPVYTNGFTSDALASGGQGRGKCRDWRRNLRTIPILKSPAPGRPETSWTSNRAKQGLWPNCVLGKVLRLQGTAKTGRGTVEGRPKSKERSLCAPALHLPRSPGDDPTSFCFVGALLRCLPARAPFNHQCFTF